MNFELLPILTDYAYQKKGVDEIKKNFAEMILGWSPSKIMSGFRPPTKMATTAELNLTWDPMGNSHKNLRLKPFTQ